MATKKKTVMASSTGNKASNGNYTVVYRKGGIQKELVKSVSFDEALQVYNETPTSYIYNSYVKIRCETNGCCAAKKERHIMVEFSFGDNVTANKLDSEDNFFAEYDTVCRLDNEEFGYYWAGTVDDVDDEYVKKILPFKYRNCDSFRVYLSDEYDSQFLSSSGRKYLVYYGDGAAEQISEDNAVVYGVSYDEALDAYNKTSTSDDSSSYVVLSEIIEYGYRTLYEIIRKKERHIMVEFTYKNGKTGVWDYEDPNREETWTGCIEDIDKYDVYFKFIDLHSRCKDYRLFLGKEKETVIKG